MAYLQDAEVHIVPFAGGEPRQLTHGARESGKTNGLAEYIAQEEMDRSSGLWWSPDSRWIAFEEVDETHIPIYRIFTRVSIVPVKAHKRTIAIHLPEALMRACGWAWSLLRVGSQYGWTGSRARHLPGARAVAA